MTITLRQTKGSRLTHAEADANITSFQASDGSSLVGFIQSGTGAVARTVQDDGRDVVNAFHFFSEAQKTAWRSGSLTVSCESGLQLAFDYALSLQTINPSGGSGGCAIHFPRGFGNYETLSLVPVSGIVSISLIGEGRGTGLRYVGTGSGGLVIKNNNNFEMRGLHLHNAGSGSPTGLTIQSLAAGSSSTQTQPGNLLITSFTTGIRIGSTGDLASSEMFLQNISIQTGTTGVVIEGASPSTNSISIHLQNVGVLACTTAFKFSGDTTAANNILTFRNCEAGSCTTDFDFQSPAHVVIDGFHTEGDTAGWKFLNTAASTAGKPPMFMEVANLNLSQAQGVSSVVAWAGSYSFRNADFSSLGITVGDAAAGNHYQFDIWGRDIPITYAGGADSKIFVSHWPANNSAANNQSVAGLAIDMYARGGAKSTLLSMPWSASSVPSMRAGVQWVQKRTAPTYGASVAIDASLGNSFTITVTDGVAFTVANPTNAVDGQLIRIKIKNTSGGAAGVLTWDTLYKLGAAWVQPATGFSRSIDFEYDGTNWIEGNRSAADVAN